MNSNSETRDARVILLVDDDEVFLRVMARALDRRGFSVRPARTVDEARSAVASASPDYAVVDLHLGPDNGLDVVEHIHRTSPDTVTVMLSGYANLASAVTAAKLGAVDCLPKPIDADELVRTLTAAADDGAGCPGNILAPSEARLQHILAHWEKNDRNTMKTAQILGMHRRTLQRILTKLGVERDRQRRYKKPSRFKKLRRLYLVWSRRMTARLSLNGQT